MKSYFLQGILKNEGWTPPVTVSVDEAGKIVSIVEGQIPEALTLDAYAIPGFQNAHSHAFQYAMAGLAEIHSTTSAPDDFWSWREAMYDLALRISPDDLEHIASQLYSELLRHGYTDVAEFHYVHHNQNGQPYGNLAEMGERLVAAAAKVGIGITLVPIFYQKGGFGKAASESQRRFLSPTIDAYFELLEASDQACLHYEHANLAIGIHSMRGVDPSDIEIVAMDGRKDLPFHIHISEQLKEVEDCIAHLNQRPVEWFLENIDVNDRFHLVHATHLDTNEIVNLAKSKANVVLCPSTEGNLGDGIFPLIEYQNAGGAWSIGTDSHVGLNPFEEFRLLDYGQRLIRHKRNSFYSSSEGDGGKFAIDMALKSGRRAMGNKSEAYFEIGSYFDACLLNAKSPLLESSSGLSLTSAMVYSSDSKMQKGTISKGKLVVIDGKHIGSERINKEFVKTIRQLGNR